MRERFGSTRCCCDDVVTVPCQCDPVLSDFNFHLINELGKPGFDDSGCSAETLDTIIDRAAIAYITQVGVTGIDYAPSDTACEKLFNIASAVNEKMTQDGTQRLYLDELCCPYLGFTCWSCDGPALENPVVYLDGFSTLTGGDGTFGNPLQDANDYADFRWVRDTINGRHVLADDGTPGFECVRAVTYWRTESEIPEEQEFVRVAWWSANVGVDPRLSLSVSFQVYQGVTPSNKFANSGSFGFEVYENGSLIPCSGILEYPLSSDTFYVGDVYAPIGDATIVGKNSNGVWPWIWAANVPGNAFNPDPFVSHDSRPILQCSVEPI